MFRDIIDAFLCNPIGHATVLKAIPLHILWSTGW